MTVRNKSPLAKFDIASLDIHEPLAESAMLARQWSKTLCNACESYHGAWQVLRLLGVFNSIRTDDDFLIRQLDEAIGSGAGRILISGAADVAQQARMIVALDDQVGQTAVLDPGGAQLARLDRDEDAPAHHR